MSRNIDECPARYLIDIRYRLHICMCRKSLVA